MARNRSIRIFAGVVIGLGVCSLVFVFARTNILKFNLLFLIAAILAISLRSRVNKHAFELKSHLVITNAVVLLAFLLYGGAPAIIIATAEALISSLRFSRDRLNIWFQTAIAAFSTFVPALAVKQLIYPNIIDEIHNGNYSNLFISLTIMSSLQFGLSSTLNAVYRRLVTGRSAWDIWKSSSAWAPITYSAGAVLAGLLAVLVDEMGFKVLLATFPIVLFVYLLNRLVLKNIQMSRSQTKQSRRYARLLEKQSLALRESEERFRSAFDFAPIGIGLVDQTGRWLKVNRSLCDIVGYSEAELLHRDFQSLIHPEDLEITTLGIAGVTNGEAQSFQTEQRYIERNGKTVWVSFSASAIRAPRDETSNLVFQLQDITDKKIAEAKLQHEATHDSLTGLPNRSLFMSRLQRSLERNRLQPEKYPLSVLFIDLDGFKVVNDKLGHAIGDMLLVEIAQRLRSCVRPEDMLARLAGDEFTILVEGVHDQERVIAIAKRIGHQFSQPFNLNGVDVCSAASVGILQVKGEHTEPKEVLRIADLTMYRAKTKGKGEYELFDNATYNLTESSIRIEDKNPQPPTTLTIDPSSHPFDTVSDRVNPHTHLAGIA